MNAKHKKELLEVLGSAAEDQALLDLFLQDLLTPGEYKEFANRWQIVKRLAVGRGHRQIADELKVGFSTVTRGVHALEDEEGGFHRMLKRRI